MHEWKWLVIGGILFLKIFGALSFVFYVRLWGIRLWVKFGREAAQRRTAILLLNLFGFQVWVQKNKNLRRWISKNFDQQVVELAPKSQRLKGMELNGFTREVRKVLGVLPQWRCFAWLQGDKIEYFPRIADQRTMKSVSLNRAFFYPLPHHHQAVHFIPKTCIARLIYWLTEDLRETHVFFVPRNQVYGL